jgi:hypothetical protein
MARRAATPTWSIRWGPFRRTTVYGEHFEPRRARFQSGIGWDAAGAAVGVGLYRERYDFSADEMGAVERTRRLLAAAAQYRSVLDLLERECADGRRSSNQTLSPRQEVVLALVATGATDAQIAVRLPRASRPVIGRADRPVALSATPRRATAAGTCGHPTGAPSCTGAQTPSAVTSTSSPSS